MDRHEVLDRIVASFHRYYDVNTTDPPEPFHVEAVYRGKDTQYVLIHKAKVFETENYEYVYFYKTEYLDREAYAYLEEMAWSDGMSRVKPHENHRTSDVTLVIIADSIEPGIESEIKRAKRHLSYRFGFHGYSSLRLVVCDLSTGSVFSNRRGSDLRKTVGNILSSI